MVFAGYFFHFEHEQEFPIHLISEHFFFLYRRVSDDIFKQLLELVAVDSSVHIVIAYFEDIVNSAGSYIDSDLSESSLHLRFGHFVGTILVDYLECLSNSDVGLLDCFEQSIQCVFLAVSGHHTTPSHFPQEFSICYRLASI